MPPERPTREEQLRSLYPHEPRTPLDIAHPVTGEFYTPQGFQESIIAMLIKEGVLVPVEGSPS